MIELAKRYYPDHCPTCFSTHQDIHGQIFKPGPIYDGGQPCTDVWHKGPEYDPNKLVLTAEDKAWLKDYKISAS